MKETYKEISKDLDHKYHEDIVSLMPGHVYWKDKDGVFLGCNLQQAKDAGFDTPADMVGKTDYDMPWSIQASYLRDIDRQVMQSGRPHTIEELFELPNGSKKVYLSKKIPLHDNNNKVSGILGISFDITERKQLEENLLEAKEQAEAANKAKTEFLENMRHDIRTPLTGIVGFAEIIKKKTHEKPVKEYADNLIASSHALLDFLNEILDAIKVLSGDLPKVRRKFSLFDITSKILQLVKPRALEKQITLNFHVDKNIPKYVIGDPARTHRILMELITNSLNFTSKGGVTVTIEKVKQQGREIVIKCSIKDTGIGIPIDKQEDVFLRFNRLTPSYKGIYKGAGLGLTIVKQFIDDINGEIYCQSQEGEGSTFICLIPLTESLLDDEIGVADISDLRSREQLPEIKYKNKTHAQESTEKPNVLIIEDQPLAAKVAETIVSGLDCVVDVAFDGDSAMKHFQEKKFDLIFMDVGLPDTNGYELTKLMRAKEWKLDLHTPIVALTAHIDSEDKQQCIESGMDAVLSKPLMHNTAQDIITAFVPKYKSGEQDDQAVAAQTKQGTKKQIKKVGNAIDLKKGMDRLSCSEEKAKKMIEMLVNGFKKDLPGLEAAKKAGDWGAVKSIVHKLYGGSLYCGVPRLQEVCAKFEKYLVSKKTEHREELYQQLLGEMEDVIKDLKDASV